jgi:undecaprenyl pyrophosphate phosphatase UppP
MVHLVMVGYCLSDKSQKKSPTIEQLEKQIENLRWAIGILIIVVSLLSCYMVLQLIQQYSFYYFFFYELALVFFLAIFLLCASCSVIDKG